MSHNYSWMKAGVRAIALNHDKGEEDESHGNIYTIACEPFQIDPLLALLNGVDPREWYIRIEEDPTPHCKCRYLKPYKEDDDSRTVTTWDDIANDLGIDIRRIQETA